MLFRASKRDENRNVCSEALMAGWLATLCAFGSITAVSFNAMAPCSVRLSLFE